MCQCGREQGRGVVTPGCVCVCWCTVLDKWASDRVLVPECYDLRAYTYVKAVIADREPGRVPVRLLVAKVRNLGSVNSEQES